MAASCPNITIGPVVVEAIKRATTLPLDVHLMIVEPEKYIEAFAKAGADIADGARGGVPAPAPDAAADPRTRGRSPRWCSTRATPLSAIEEVLGDVEMVLVMSVNPGFGGQSFIESTVDKVRRLRAMLDARGLKRGHRGRRRHQRRDGEAGGGGGRQRCWWRAAYVFGAKDYAQAIRSLRPASSEAEAREPRRLRRRGLGRMQSATSRATRVMKVASKGFTS